MKKVALISDGWKRLVTYNWMDGMLGRAKEIGISVNFYQFNTNGNWSRDKKHNAGEYNLFDLPNYEEYDGIVFDCTNMTDQKQIRRIVKKLKSTKIPVVSISYAVDGFYYVGNNNKKIFREILDHLHDVHGCRNFVFAGGPDYNYENQVRFEAFEEAMKDYGIAIKEEQCLFGDFDFYTGVDDLEEWLAAGKALPDCFVCANDNIAAGVCHAAAKHGIRIPEDVIVTGFDNLDKAAYYKPQIMTAEHNRGNIGGQALQILVDIWEGREVEAFTYLDSEVIPGESCGCGNSGRIEYREYIKNDIDYRVKKDRDDEEVMVLEKNLRDCESFDEIFRTFAEYIEGLDCDGIYIVVDRTLLEAHLGADFTVKGYDRQRLVLGYASHRRHGIAARTLEELQQFMDREEKENLSYMFSAIHFRDQTIGFTILENPRFLYDNPYFYDLHITFVTLLESYYKQAKLEKANAQMREIYNRDALTGLYNRMAYEEMILPHFHHFCEKNVVCAMTFFDADNFKQINDTYGHKYGDRVLKTIADVLRATKPEDGYAYRFGGDEFVVFFPYATPDKVENFMGNVRAWLRRRKIKVSIGVILSDPKSGKPLDDYLVEADQKMYEVKSERKRHPEPDPVFRKGVDISSLPEHLDGGEKFYNAQGRQIDPFDLLVENHVDSVRLRIWNDPSQVPESKGYCDLEHTLRMAKKIRDRGLHFFLDFHYSDFWADPGQQRKPKAWQDLTFYELEKAVYDYTREVLLALEKEGCLPDMVQVGNEIRSGMLFPEGEVPSYVQLAKLVNAGIAAVRDTSPDIQVMIHLDQGGRFYYLKEWFDAMFAAGMEPIDAIGISFYSFWHGTFMDLRDSMTQLIERYHIPVYVVETAHPWRHCEGEHVSRDLMETAGFAAGIEAQKRSLALVMQIAAEVSGDFSTGVYYWEPLCIPGRTYGSWDENMGMLDERGRALPSFEVYRDFDPANPPIEDLDSYMEKLYEEDESGKHPAGENLIANGDFSEGTKGWWIEKKPEGVVVEERAGEIYVSSKSNFTFRIFREFSVRTAGVYRLSADYRGTNTTGVEVRLFLKEIGCNGEIMHEKMIYPSDVRFVTHSLEELELSKGTVQLGISITSPPVFGRIARISLERIEK